MDPQAPPKPPASNLASEAERRSDPGLIPAAGSLDFLASPLPEPLFTVTATERNSLEHLEMLEPVQLPLQARHILGDFDGDGRCDGLVEPPEGPAQLEPYSLERLAHALPVYVPDHDAIRGDSIDSQSWMWGGRLDALDLDGDGHIDLVAGNPGLDEYGDWARDDGGWALYRGGPSGISRTPTLYTAGSSGFGARLRTIGDFNGDGMSDLAISDPDAENGAGRVYVLLGSTTPLPETFDITAPSERTVVFMGDPTTTLREWQDDYPFDGMHLGASLTPAGDLDGDGLDDLIIGYAGYEERGLVIAFGRSKSADAAQVRLSAPSRRPYPNRPVLIAVSGQFNLDGDGYADLVLAVQLRLSESASLFAVFGGPKIRKWSANLPLETLASRDRVLRWVPPSLASLGPPVDLDGDNLSELVIFGTQRIGRKPARNVARIVSGAHLERLANLDAIGSPSGRTHGWLVELEDGAPVAVGVCDITGDGRRDLLIEQNVDDVLPQRSSKFAGIRGM